MLAQRGSSLDSTIVSLEKHVMLELGATNRICCPLRQLPDFLLQTLIRLLVKRELLLFVLGTAVFRVVARGLDGTHCTASVGRRG